mgnify:CR=1 FL=1
MPDKEKALKFFKHEKEIQLVSQFYRNLGIFLANPLINTSITPNQISAISIIIALSGVYVLSLGTYSYFVLGAILFQVSIILDRVDGALARRKNMASTFGKWIEYNFDVITDVLIIFGATIGLFIQTNSSLVLILGMIFIMLRVLILNINTALFVCFDSPGEVFNKETQNKLITQFIPTRTLIFLLFTVFILFNRLYEFLIFIDIYLAIFFLVSLIYLSFEIWQKENG